MWENIKEKAMCFFKAIKIINIHIISFSPMLLILVLLEYSFFISSAESYQFNFIILKLSESCSKRSFMSLTEDEALLQKHSQNKTITVNDERQKWPWLKIWWEVIIMYLMRTFCYFCNTHFKRVTRIMT